MIIGARIKGKWIISDIPKKTKIAELEKMQLLRMGYY
jgi:hypothetical protein